MDRRDFIKVSGTAAAGLALTGCGPRTGETPVPVLPPVDPSRIVRDVERLEPLYVKEIHVKVGASKPFGVLHVSDTHSARADNRDDERKIKLAASRSCGMTYGEHYLDEAIRYARDKGLYMMHTGDMYDFVSEANLDCCAHHMLEADWFVCAGNHE